MDVEGDLPGILAGGGTRGIDEGLPEFLSILDDFQVKADFFFLARIAKDRPDLVKRLAKAGHGIGNHGLDHRFLCTRPVDAQRQDVLESTRILERATSARPTMFRAPNFSVNRATLRILEQAGYSIDSSVLPGRHVKRFGILRAYDHRGAPQEPYWPLRDDRHTGGNDLLEVPVTANPLQPGTPVGLGALNRFGPGPLVELFRTTTLRTVLFLAHPWEAIDLASAYPGIPQGYARVCSSNLQPFHDFLQKARFVAQSSTLGQVADQKGRG